MECTKCKEFEEQTRQERTEIEEQKKMIDTLEEKCKELEELGEKERKETEEHKKIIDILEGKVKTTEMMRKNDQQSKSTNTENINEEPLQEKRTKSDISSICPRCNIELKDVDGAVVFE